MICTAEFSGPFNSVLNKILRESVLYLCSIACKKQEEPIEYLEYSLLISKNHFVSLNFYISIINPLPHYQFCLQVCETASWPKLQCCYSSNMPQHWLWGMDPIYFCKVDHSRISIKFLRNWLGLNNLLLYGRMTLTWFIFYGFHFSELYIYLAF